MPTAASVEAGDRRAAAFEQPGEAVEVVDEAALAVGSGGAPPKPPWA